MQAHEKRSATALVSAALAMGYSMSVYDGEEWALRRSTDQRAILAELGATDVDWLHFHKPDGTQAGAAMLVYGNGPGELVADYTANPLTESIIAKAAA